MKEIGKTIPKTVKEPSYTLTEINTREIFLTVNWKETEPTNGITVKNTQVNGPKEKSTEKVHGKVLQE
jgi:hypothetical protein